MLESIKTTCAIVWFLVLIVIAFAFIYNIISGIIQERESKKQQIKFQESLFSGIKKAIDNTKEKK